MAEDISMIPVINRVDKKVSSFDEYHGLMALKRLNLQTI